MYQKKVASKLRSIKGLNSHKEFQPIIEHTGAPLAEEEYFPSIEGAVNLKLQKSVKNESSLANKRGEYIIEETI